MPNGDNGEIFDDDFTKNVNFLKMKVYGKIIEFKIQRILEIKQKSTHCSSYRFYNISLCSPAIIKFDPYLNTSVTLVADFVTYFSVFISLFLFDNRKKYKSISDKIDWFAVKSDLKKILSSVGIGEIVYLTSRWFFQFHFLNIGFVLSGRGYSTNYCLCVIYDCDKYFYKTYKTLQVNSLEEFGVEK